MEALHDVVKAGKARYIGASAMWAWQFSKMQHAAEGCSSGLGHVVSLTRVPLQQNEDSSASPRSREPAAGARMGT
jgi:aryl-alcohol dehydrogenase-like predicted oxidoreductase